MPASTAFAARFDERHHSRFAHRGMGAGTGQYTAPGADTSTDARVYINRSQSTVGEYQQQVVDVVTIEYFLADVVPAVDGVLVLDGETWINDSETNNDGSLSTWAVRRG
ncbi:hypothetical protein [Tahibacter harae]|uniref:Uncharacterized protein n=1 Tax=Tahibacter harae TaxID=2963937 RepID=A0ABT1QS97_9GAMM|nr:hypothetical protein [Tahibacter harae]MCQ4165137.1 hypothetical protein [Tahibacter harae]